MDGLVLFSSVRSALEQDGHENPLDTLAEAATAVEVVGEVERETKSRR